MQYHTSSMCFVHVIRVYNNYHVLAEELYTYNWLHLYTFHIYCHVDYIYIFTHWIYVCKLFRYIIINTFILYKGTFHIQISICSYYTYTIYRRHKPYIIPYYILYHILYHLWLHFMIAFISDFCITSIKPCRSPWAREAEKLGFDSSSRTVCSYSIDAVVPWRRFFFGTRTRWRFTR